MSSSGPSVTPAEARIENRRQMRCAKASQPISYVLFVCTTRDRIYGHLECVASICTDEEGSVPAKKGRKNRLRSENDVLWCHSDPSFILADALQRRRDHSQPVIQEREVNRSDQDQTETRARKREESDGDQTGTLQFIQSSCTNERFEAVYSKWSVVVERAIY